MIPKLINLTICVAFIQFISSCAAPLTEQCRQLKVAQNMRTESYNASEKETDFKKKGELLQKSFREKNKTLRNLSVSDSYLKNIQERLIKYNEDAADSIDDVMKLSNAFDEYKIIHDDLQNYCQS